MSVRGQAQVCVWTGIRVRAIGVDSGLQLRLRGARVRAGET